MDGVGLGVGEIESMSVEGGWLPMSWDEDEFVDPVPEMLACGANDADVTGKEGKAEAGVGTDLATASPEDCSRVSFALLK